jgi:hypothetical protein
MWNYTHADVGDRNSIAPDEDVPFPGAPISVAGAGDIFQMRFQVDF